MRIGWSPRSLAHAMERERRLPSGREERFTGYGILGLSFASGHVLAFRHFVATSIGPPFTSIWHRTPEGSWTIYANVVPSKACPRLFGSGLDHAIVEEIDLVWTGATELSLSMRRVPFQWAVRLRATAATRALGGIGRLLPGALWRDERVLNVVGAAAGRALGTGRLPLHGRTPNGQQYAVKPRALWEVEASAAILDGEEFGPIAPMAEPPLIGGTPIPSRGILAFIDEFNEPLDPGRHSTAVTRNDAGAAPDDPAMPADGR